jgi:hypothetical protein
MAGGQAITSGQGSVTVSGSVPLAGAALSSESGLVSPPPAEEALTGSEATAEAGSTAPTRLVSLKSRKVGGGAATHALTGLSASLARGDFSPAFSKTPLGIALTGSQGAFTKTRTRAVTGTSVSTSAGTMTAGEPAEPAAANYVPLTNFSLTTTAASGTYPFTIGLSFKKGDVPASISTDLTNYQATVKRTWNDGSAKHIIVSGRAELVQNVARMVVVNPGTPPTGTALTSADITAANPSASIQCGSIGTLTLASLLASPFRTWISGPQMVECHYRGNIGSGNLSGWFHVRLYADGRVWVRAIVENGYLDNGSGSLNSNSTQNYVPNIGIGGTGVYTNGGASLAHYANTRYSAEGWAGGDPQITPTHNNVYLRASKLVPHYGFLNASSATLGAQIQTYTPMSRGPHSADMGATGDQPGIGVLPNWDALFVATGDARAYRGCLTGSSCLNSYAIVWRDKTTHLPPRPSTFTNWTIYGPNGGGDDGITAGPNRWEVHHHSNGGYLAYLLTGDYWHLETAYLEAATCYLIISQARGSGVNRQLNAGQTRGYAWSIRTIGLLAAIAPDSDTTVAADYRTLLSNNFTQLKGFIDANGSQIWSGSVFQSVYGNWGGAGSIAPWMTDFWVQTNGFISDTEPLSTMTNLLAVRDHMYRWPVGRMGATGDTAQWPFTRAVSSAMEPSVSGDSDWRQTWPLIYIASGNPTNNTTSNTLTGTSGADPTQIGTGYWGNIHPAIAYAVEHSATGAMTSWERLLGATNYYNNASSTGSTGFPNVPVFGIYPRSGRIIRVGPTRTLTTMSQAASAVREGDTIEIDAGTYTGTQATATFSTNNITIKGVGGRAVMMAAGQNAQGKGTWVCSGSPITIESVDHHDAAVPDQNGSGVRIEGAFLTLTNCGFFDCENGIQGGDTAGTVVLSGCEFDHNGVGDPGFTHNVYVGAIDLVIAKGCHFHDATIGHNFKSRARANHIEDCYFVDGASGDSSYLADFPDGGKVYIRGSCFHKGVNAQNSSSIAYAQESLPSNRRNTLTLVHNTLVSTRSGGSFIAAPSGTTSVTWTANIFAGNGTSQISGGFALGNVVQSNNVVNTHTNVPNAATSDFTPNATLMALAALAGTPDPNYLTQALTPMSLSQITTTPILAGAIQTSAAWAPGYTLPAAGQAIALGTTNKLTNLNASGLSGTDLEYSVSGSFGGGRYAREYSDGGAYVMGCSGGHAHPDFTSCIALDFTDRTFKLIVNSNGAPNSQPGFTTGQLGSFGELSSFVPVPMPGHPYTSYFYLSPALGGGTKGSLLVTATWALTQSATGGTGRAHVMDLDTGTWTRYSPNAWTDVANGSQFLPESQTVYSTLTNRWYLLPEEIHNVSTIPYLQASNATWVGQSLGGFPSTGAASRAAFYESQHNLIVIQVSSTRLRRLDLDSPTSGLSDITVTGSLPGDMNQWCRCEKDGAYYTYSGSGQVLNKMVFTSQSAVTVSTVTLTGATLPTNIRNTNTRHYTRFFPVPSLGNDIFCWWPGGATQDAYLIRIP